MWIQNYFRRAKLRKAVTTPSKEPAPLRTIRARCEALLTELSTQSFQKYNPSAASGLTVTVGYTTIDLYIRKLKEAIALVKQEEAISPTWYATHQVSVPLDRFFTSSDGFYLNVEKSVVQLRTLGIELCQLMARSDTETHGLYEHNLRMLTKLLTNLYELAHRLIEANLTKT